MEIRPALLCEYDAVAAFYDRLIDEMQSAVYKPGWEKGIYPTYAFLEESIRRQELYILLLEGEIAAAMVLNRACTDGYERIVWQIEAPPEEISVIHALGLRPVFQGKGLAKAMVAEAIRLCRKRGDRSIRLDVLGGNEPALGLYPAMGFRYMGTLQLYYEDTGLTDFWLYEYLL